MNKSKEKTVFLNNFKSDLKNVKFYDLEWIQLAHNRGKWLGFVTAAVSSISFKL